MLARIALPELSMIVSSANGCSICDQMKAGQCRAVWALAAQLDDNTLDVTELPVKKWTQDYKEHLESLLKADEKVPPLTLLPKSCSMRKLVDAEAAAVLGKLAGQP